MDSLVSIVIPCYNSEPFLSDTLVSIVNQDYPNIETILVDDGCSDRSVEIAESFKNQLHIKIIQQKNAGVSAARNNGFRNASGKYVIFLDSDDILLPNFVSSKTKLLENGEFNCAGSHIFNFTCVDDLLASDSDNVSVSSDIRSILLNYIPHFSSVPSSFMFRSELFMKSSETPFNLLLMSTADRYLLIEYAEKLKVVIDDAENSGLRYRIRTDSMSNVYNRKLIDDNALFYKELIRNKLISAKEIKKGYKLLLKSYAKIKQYGMANIYLTKLLRSSIQKTR